MTTKNVKRKLKAKRTTRRQLQTDVTCSPEYLSLKETLDHANQEAENLMAELQQAKQNWTTSAQFDIREKLKEWIPMCNERQIGIVLDKHEVKFGWREVWISMPYGKVLLIGVKRIMEMFKPIQPTALEPIVPIRSVTAKMTMPRQWSWE